ncbi:MAG: molybdenum cofactor guanylyltransferase [Planctomycetes bacterium]|nr:molybdenum cofactor guanylyltransferase [Planctomycetota bacterium]
MVEAPPGGRRKPWADALAPYADRIVSCRGAACDMDWKDVQLLGGRWTVRMPAAAILLAGGGSTRMGTDKALLPLDGKPMLGQIYEQVRPWFRRIVVSSNNAAAHGALGAPVLPDEVPDQGPLRGIVSALKAVPEELCFVTACDVPVVDIDLVRSLIRQAGDYDGVPIAQDRDGGPDAVVPYSGRPEPLHAVYRRRVLPVFEQCLASGRYRMTEALNRCRVKYVPVAPDRIRNLNTMDEYRRYLGRADDVDPR